MNIKNKLIKIEFLSFNPKSIYLNLAGTYFISFEIVECKLYLTPTLSSFKSHSNTIN